MAPVIEPTGATLFHTRRRCFVCDLRKTGPYRSNQIQVAESTTTRSYSRLLCLVTVCVLMLVGAIWRYNQP